jgi:pentatricopeptide repeat protein
VIAVGCHWIATGSTRGCGVIAMGLTRGCGWDSVIDTWLRRDCRAIGSHFCCPTAGAQWQEGLLLLHEMKQRGPRPDAISYNTAISAAGRAGRWEVALRLLDELTSSAEPVRVAQGLVVA